MQHTIFHHRLVSWATDIAFHGIYNTLSMLSGTTILLSFAVEHCPSIEYVTVGK